jgi:hypothetical protein
MKNCGRCRFFKANTLPRFLKPEQDWVWPGSCMWKSHPIPYAAVMTCVFAHAGTDCQTWEGGMVDYIALMESMQCTPTRKPSSSSDSQ